MAEPVASHPKQANRAIVSETYGDHILAFVLAFARGLHLYIPQQLRREWKKSPLEAGDVLHLPETTALVVGVGGIGGEAARLLAAFGVTVLGTDARRSLPIEGVAEMHKPETLDELLPRADFVILTVPHTPATEGFFNRARFQRMKPSAFFINIGRGMTTKLDDLVEALKAGEIAGAALDVYEIEPLPKEHPDVSRSSPQAAPAAPECATRSYSLGALRRSLADGMRRAPVDLAEAVHLVAEDDHEQLAEQSLDARIGRAGGGRPRRA